MLKFSRRQLLLFCLIHILFVTQAFFIKPGYGNVVRNKPGHTTVCVEIKPNIAGSHEPYYMCKGPELTSRQQVLPPFVKSSAEMNGNFNKQQSIKTNEATYQHFEPPKNIQFGNAFQQSPQSAQSVQGKEEYYAQPQMPQQMPHYISSPLTALNMADHQHDNTAPNAHSYYTDIPAKIPLNSPSNSHPNNYENIPQSSSNLSKTDILPTREITQSYERSPSQKQDISRTQKGDLSGLETPTRDKIKHPINHDDFQNLLQEEVLGMPNLGFSHDDLLPIHNMYSEDNPEFNVAPQGPSIPPEYLDDPILRTFYNINQNTNSNFEEPAITSQNYGDFKGNINDCLNAQPHSMSEYLPLTEPMAPNKCCGCPYTFQPIFIAIPWFANSYHNLQTNMPSTTCGNFPTYGQTLAYDSTPTHENPYQPHSRSNSDNSSTEDLTSKKPLTQPEIKITNTQPSTKTTKPAESSEEDLFAEDTTTKPSKASKTEDDTSNEGKENYEEEELKTSTTNVPFTTVRTFKTMMHAAKMAAKMAGRSNTEDIHQPQNKRQIHYVGYPNNFKRQYVRKLERMYK